MFFSRQLFVGNLCNITLESLREYCEKYGTISDLQLNRDKDKNVREMSFFSFFGKSNDFFLLRFIIVLLFLPIKLLFLQHNSCKNVLI